MLFWVCHNKHRNLVKKLRSTPEYIYMTVGHRAKAARTNLKNCGFSDKAKLKTTDAVLYLSGAFERFDIAFLDPPYAAQQLPLALPAVARVMRPGGVVFCETAKGIDLPEKADGLVKVKEYRYGRTMVYSYRKEDEE